MSVCLARQEATQRERPSVFSSNFIQIWKLLPDYCLVLPLASSPRGRQVPREETNDIWFPGPDPRRWGWEAEQDSLECPLPESISLKGWSQSQQKDHFALFRPQLPSLKLASHLFMQGKWGPPGRSWSKAEGSTGERVFAAKQTGGVGNTQRGCPPSGGHSLCTQKDAMPLRPC